MIYKKYRRCLVVLVAGAMLMYPVRVSAYSRTLAQEYAIKWSSKDANNNDKYNTKEYYNAGLDCTNFVSQCMVAGGMKPSSSLPTYYSTKHWRPHSATWENATYWRKYWKDRTQRTSGNLDNSGVTRDTINSKMYQKLQVGDIIQHGSSTSDIRHSQIVVGRIYDSVNKVYTLRMAQHTSNDPNINFYKYIGIAGSYICGYHINTK